MSEKARVGIIHVSAYLFELEPTGETGKSDNDKDIKNLKLTIGPAEKSECVRQIKEFLEKIEKIEK